MTAAPAPAAPLLRACALTLARNDETIFGPLDFELNGGETVLLEGDNGSGKTSLLKMLCGLLLPSSGELLFDGVPLTHTAVAGHVALLSHQLGLKADLPASANLHFAMALHGHRPDTGPDELLARLGLEGYDDVPLRMLSAGQRKRVALARLLLVPARLWLLDEPYANLDRHGIALVNEMLSDHARSGGGALVTSHGAFAFGDGSQRRVLLGAAA